MQQTFSEFKRSFYSRIPDLSIFDCRDFNLLKVVLDGLKVNYKARGIQNQLIFRNFLYIRLVLFVKKLKHARKVISAKKKLNSVKENLNVPLLFFDNGRVANDNNGHSVSFYFNKIGMTVGRHNYVTIYQQRTMLTDGECLPDLFLATHFEPLKPQDVSLIKGLRQSYLTIKSLGVFSEDELLNIRVAISKFFDEYRFWAELLRGCALRVALFDEHYHREGFIYALKNAGISAVELQHGLIAPEDIFYVFPESARSIAARALFPDKIFTYGRYWQDVLYQGSEFTSDQIEILGIYQEVNTYLPEPQKKSFLHFIEEQDFVLVTTQTFMHKQFVDFVGWLSNDLNTLRAGHKIVVKTHPSEKRADYRALENFQNVLVTDINTEYLLSSCKWHISCYSTTLYEATKYNCQNYSLNFEGFQDYISTFVKEGISTLIEARQNPVFFESKPVSHITTKKQIFENFEDHKHKLLNLNATTYERV